MLATNLGKSKYGEHDDVKISHPICNISEGTWGIIRLRKTITKGIVLNNRKIIDNDKADFINEGEFVRDKHTNFWQTLNNGILHKCYILNGKIEGLFEEIYPNGKIIISKVVDGKRNGPAEFRFSNKIYKGEMKDDVKIGIWEMIEPNGQITRVEISNGHFMGQCTKILPNGTIIKGEIKNNTEMGIWEMTDNRTGQITRCERSNGKFNGDCLKIITNGNIYKGKIRDDYEVGIWEMTDTIGRITRCEISNGKFNGDGLKIVEGAILKGQIRDGEEIGIWEMTDNRTGQIIRCERSNGRFNGPCEIILKNESVLKCNMTNGLTNGDFEMIKKDGSIIKGEIKNSEFIGICELTEKNGKVFKGKLIGFKFYKEKLCQRLKCSACMAVSNINIDDYTSYDESVTICTICLETPANVFLPKCKHIVFCNPCAKTSAKYLLKNTD